MSALDAPIQITDKYTQGPLARAVPEALYQDGAWWLPPQPSPDAARVALRLFPKLQGAQPELVARARLSAVDHTPIDHATPWWDGLSDAEQSSWRARMVRVRAQCEITGITPHEFQIRDSAYFARRLEEGKGAYCGAEMGLGKTLIACLVMDAWDVNFALVAAPNNAKIDPWKDGIERFCPWMKPIVVGNTPKARAEALAEAISRMNAGDPTALIVHYQALKLIEGANKRGWLPFGRFDIKIGDEGHLLGNRAAQFTSAFRRISACGTLLLSGSVMSGAAERLFPAWQIMQPKRYRSQWRDWSDRFLEVIEGQHGKIVIGPKLHRLPEFRAELGECLVVRRAKDHLDVPEPHIIEPVLHMHPEQAVIYRQVADELFAALPDGDVIATTDGSALRTALRRVTAGIPDLDGCLISAKHDAAMTAIEASGDSQWVVFGWHKRTVRELARRCAAANIPCGVIDGDVPHAQREVAIDLFKRGGYRVLVATIATLSQAANLQNASCVGMLEESDDPVQNEQAVGRVVRQGQTAHASVFRWRIEGSVDDLDVSSNALSKAELRRMVLGC